MLNFYLCRYYNESTFLVWFFFSLFFFFLFCFCFHLPLVHGCIRSGYEVIHTLHCVIRHCFIFLPCKLCTFTVYGVVYYQFVNFANY